MAESVLKSLKDDGYQLGDCQVILYDRKRVDFFEEGYLTRLYQGCKTSGRRGKLGILPNLFCGMHDLSHDAITMYLAGRPVLVPGVWRHRINKFVPAGIGFPSALPIIGVQGSARALFAGYGLFKWIWGQPEAEILGMLGLAYFFNEFNVTAIHGLRYRENGLTARFTHKYGFKDNGYIPRYMVQDGQLVGAIASSLLIEDFEQYVERKLVELLQTGELDKWAAAGEKAAAEGQAPK